MASKRPAWATRTGPVTAEERERIIALADRGWPFARTARELGRHPSSIFHYYVVEGFIAPKTRRTDAYTRNGRTVRPFCEREDHFIEELSARGLNNSEISRRVAHEFGHPRQPATIKYRLCMLAAVELSDEAAIGGAK